MLEPFWKGSFLPIAKHVRSVAFVSRSEMRAGDWDVLDFPELRPKAKSNLVRNIVAGNLEGFFRVNYDMHKRSHGGKPTYYYPAEDRDIDRFDSGLVDDGRFETFGEGYDETDVDEFPEFERPYNRLTSYTSAITVPAAVSLFNASRNGEEQTYRPEPEFEEWPDWAVDLYIMSELFDLFTNDRSTFDTIAGDYGVDSAGMERDEAIDAVVDGMEEGAREEQLDSGSE